MKFFLKKFSSLYDNFRNSQNFRGSFHPLDMKTGQNKETRVSYFSDPLKHTQKSKQSEAKNHPKKPKKPSL